MEGADRGCGGAGQLLASSLVDKMLDLHEKLKKAKTPHDRELIERQIKATDSQIDRLVYELYGLTTSFSSS